MEFFVKNVNVNIRKIFNFDFEGILIFYNINFEISQWISTKKPYQLANILSS